MWKEQAKIKGPDLTSSQIEGGGGGGVVMRLVVSGPDISAEDGGGEFKKEKMASEKRKSAGYNLSYSVRKRWKKKKSPGKNPRKVKEE